MSSDIYSEFGHSISDASREAQRAGSEMDEAIATFLGLNSTDARCVDVLTQYGPQLAGELAAHLSLTTGAVTTVVDRLEKLGFVERERSADDRRKVIVRVTPLGGQVAWEIYRPFVEAWSRHTHALTMPEWVAVAKYLRLSKEVAAAYTPMVRALEVNDASLAEKLVAVRALEAPASKINVQVESD